MELQLRGGGVPGLNNGSQLDRRCHGELARRCIHCLCAENGPDIVNVPEGRLLPRKVVSA